MGLGIGLYIVVMFYLGFYFKHGFLTSRDLEIRSFYARSKVWRVRGMRQVWKWPTDLV